MKFIVDAQLPRRLAAEIKALGEEVVHTLDFPLKNATADSEIIRLAVEQRAVVVTKDRDFVDRYLLKGEPPKLLFITTGNIPNNDLISLIRTNWRTLHDMFEQGDFIELSRTAATLHM